MLCGSEVGRKTLRIKGIYALLREFDRASSAEKNYKSPINENSIMHNHSQSRIHEQQDLQVESGRNIQKMDAEKEAISMQGIKFLGETGNLIYIDGKNCSTLHALIGLLIQD
ncbi:unnamed protein product [Onchocerca flexuosa]|uniref:DUF384 domain-containing protein n=1 Tax=Onchocerca flexuosa TaxID=387005 RepID=A0A183HEV9_9BILA|nr:unnamed protein product [Onchocerca flexuosa]